MSDAPVQLIVAAFQTESGAKEALNKLKEAKKEDLLKILNAALISMNAKGKVKIWETGDMKGGKGALIGGALGFILPGVGTLVGAAIGGLAAKMRDSGFNDKRLATIGQSLKPGTSAIVAVVEHTWVTQVEAAMREEGANVVTEAISEDIQTTLAKGNELGISALASDDSIEIGRLESEPEA
jgi:uncharacterized membrane protein